MWWALAKRGIAFVDRGTVGTLLADHGVAQVTPCEDGGEFEVLRAAFAHVPASPWQVLLGPSLVEWRALDRISGIWRQREREIAARALLLASDDEVGLASNAYAIHVADPAPQSRWVCYLIAPEIMLAANSLAVDRKRRWLTIESLAAVAASGVEHGTGFMHVVAMICAHDVAWIVKDRTRVVDCGVWRDASEPEAVAADCRRLQITYGIPNDRVLILRRNATLEAVQFDSATGEWTWINRKLARLFTPVQVEIDHEHQR